MFVGCIVIKNGVGVFDMLFKNKMAINNGIEVVSVYMMKYDPAVRRSACCPHRVMRTRVGIRVASNMMYIKVRFDAMNVNEIVTCNSATVIKNIRCRCSGSVDIMCWLAMIISGRSQNDSVSSGAEIVSRSRYMLDMGFKKVFWFSSVRLIMARRNVYEIIVWYRIVGFSRRADGISVMVAIMIFNIIVGLGF